MGASCIRGRGRGTTGRTQMTSAVAIGGAAGFAGDRTDAAAPLVDALARFDGPRFLMFETLAERTLALSQLERRSDPGKGYNPALTRFVGPVLERCLRHGIRIVGNFGAANPQAAADRILAAARETDGKILQGANDIVAANVYLGAAPIAEALDQSADVVVTGRVADSALALGPLMHALRWRDNDWDRLAAGTLAGHLLECGSQVTGGYFADPPFKNVPGMAELGYPIVEIDDAGHMVVTKPPATGGRADRLTVI